MVGVTLCADGTVAGMAKTLLFLCLVMLSNCAFADLIKENYITIELNGSSSRAVVDFESDNLERFIELDDSGNGIVSWRELRAHRSEIEALVLEHFGVEADGAECLEAVDGFDVYRRVHQSYIKLTLGLSCKPDPQKVSVGYDLFFDVDPQQKAFLKIGDTNLTKPAVLSGGRRDREFLLEKGSLLEEFAAFFREGVWHIWIGFDHILFLVMLLLPSVYLFKGAAAVPRSGFREIGAEVLKIVTAFSAAHSVTLGLSASSIVSVNGTLVEVAIALSILVTALDNMLRFVPVKGWVVALLFGLVHGFGFANVLQELIERGSGSFFALLAGFNLGVEAGQLAIVSVLLPLMYLLRETLFYRVFIYSLLSVLAILISAVWAVERWFGLSIIGI